MKIFSPTITGSLGVLGNTILDGNLTVTGGITGSLLGTASFATSAATASFLPSTTNLNITSITASGGNFVNLTAVSASFGYVQTVTGSAVIIGDEFIILNADTPTARYAGLIVYDSGSGSPATASFEWDGLTDNWIVQEETGNTAVVLTGPTGSRGTEVLPTVNVLQKGGGHHQLVNSSITDNGSNVTFTTPIAGTSISASTGFLGNLTGTASFATSASFAPSTPAFPFTGSAVITGSLTVTGSISTNNTVSLTGTNKWINSVTTGAYPVGDGLIAVASANAAVNASARYSGVFASTNATIGSNGFMAFVLGGDLNDADGIRTGVVGGYNNNVSVGNSYIFGGSNNDVTGGTSEMILVGGNNINITGGTTSIGLGGTNNTISGGANNAILAGTGSTNNQNRSVVIGGQGISATAADTVYVPNFDVSGSSTFKNNIVVTGSINATSFTGSLNGTASFATSASFATTASFALNAAPTFPFTGNAQINGNLSVTGSYLRLSGSFSGSVIDNITDTFTTSPPVEHVVSLTQVEYNTISGSADPNTLYYITDAPSFVTSASFASTASFFSLASVDQDTVITGSVRGNVSALSISSNTASMDLSNGNFYTLTLVSGSNTFINPSNIAPGQTINLRVKQPSPGFGTVSFPSSVKQVSGSAYVPTAAQSTEDIVTFISFDASNLYLSNVKNLV